MKYLLLFAAIALTTSCTTAKKSMNMLDLRADYHNKSLIDESINSLTNNLLTPRIQKPQVAHIWVSPHESSSGDFHGGEWIHLLVSPPHWIIPPTRLKDRKASNVNSTPISLPKKSIKPKSKRLTRNLIKRTQIKRTHLKSSKN